MPLFRRSRVALVLTLLLANVPLGAHHVDATFGDMIVTPLPPE